MAAVTICSDFGAQENKACHCFHCFPICLPWSDGTRWIKGSSDGIKAWLGAMIIVFWVLSFKPDFLLNSFTFIKRLFSFFAFCYRVVSSEYLRLLIFFLAILIPSCASSSLAFHIMYSAYKLNKQDDNTVSIYSFPNLEPVHCFMSGSNCCFLTCMQISQEAGTVVWYSHLFKNFSQFVFDPHSQRLSCTKWSRNRCFSGIPLLFVSDQRNVGNLKLEDTCSLEGKLWQTHIAY